MNALYILVSRKGRCKQIHQKKLSESELRKVAELLKNGNNQFMYDVYMNNKDYCIQRLMSKFRADKMVAEDIFTDAVISLREKILNGKLTEIVNVKAYLSGTCKNIWLSELKRSKKDSVRDYGDIEDLYDRKIMELDMHSALAYREEIMNQLRKGLDKLDKKCRGIITSYYMDRRNMNEIAKIFGFANANVAKTTKMRCFNKLKKLVFKDNASK